MPDGNRRGSFGGGPRGTAPAAAPTTQSAASLRQPRRTAAMPVALALVLGGFVFAAVISVIAIGTWTGWRNTVDLLGQRAAVVLDAAEQKLALHLESARAQASFIAETIAVGEIDPGDRSRFVPMVQGALAATPQITGLYFIGADHRLIGAERDEDAVVPFFAGLALDPDIRRLVQEAAQHRDPFWADLLWRDEWHALQVNLRAPVWRGDTFLGVVLANVSVPSLSRFMADMESVFGYNAFILIDRSRVLAHPLLQFGRDDLDRWHPMPSLAETGDPVLMSIWDPQARDAGLSEYISGGAGHAVRLADRSYVFMYDEVSGYGPKPWLVGTYLPADGLSAEIERMAGAIAVCGGVLVVVLALAAWLGRRISIPARRLAVEARRIHSLDFSQVRPVPGSYFREINEAAEAFNAMQVGLKWFQAYVPKTLVRRLIATRRIHGMQSEQREVTVMFTDIADFSHITSRLTPVQTADLLNAHFALVNEVVDAEGGTVDKYIGDSAMAFFGAPEDQPDHAERALRAARTLAKRLRAAPPGPGGVPIRVRIGLHTGDVLVGDIGTADRLNYTVVGQPVSLAQRVEQYAKVLPGAQGRPVTVLATAATVRSAGWPAESVGVHRLRGLETAVELFRID